MGEGHIATALHWIMLASLVLIAWPICIYGLHILRVHWSNIYFVKRKRDVTLTISILACLALFLALPITTIECLVYGSWSKVPDYALGPVLILSKLCAFSNTVLILVRIWLYYFDVQLAKELSCNEWKILLNQQYTAGWFTANKDTFGSQRHLLTISATFLFAFITAYSVIMFTASEYTDYFTVTFFVLTAISCIFVWCKYPEFQDQLGIRRETKIFAMVWISLCGVMYCLVIIHKMTEYASTDVFYAGALFIVYGNSLTAVYMTTVNVYHQFISKQTRSERVLSRLIADSSNNSLQDMVKDIDVKSWKPVIAKIEGYEVFMSHLVKEFSTENLLFLTEFAQFKATLVELYPSKMKSEEFEEELSWTLQLPSSSELPLSSVACEYKQKIESESNDGHTAHKATDIGTVQLAEFMTACSKIYEKYIKANTAPLEVNISSKKRNLLTQIFGNANSWKEMMGDGSDTGEEEMMFKTTLLRFQSAALDIEGLMNDSFTRFKETEVAKEYWLRHVAEHA